MNISTNLIDRAKKKAGKSNCRYLISAIGINNKGEIVYSSFNKPRFQRLGGGNHAEMIVMLKSPPSLKTILLCRVNASGKLLPIHPCKSCKSKAEDLNIKIVTIKD